MKNKYTKDQFEVIEYINGKYGIFMKRRCLQCGGCGTSWDRIMHPFNKEIEAKDMLDKIIEEYNRSESKDGL